MQWRRTKSSQFQTAGLILSCLWEGRAPVQLLPKGSVVSGCCCDSRFVVLKVHLMYYHSHGDLLTDHQIQHSHANTYCCWTVLVACPFASPVARRTRIYTRTTLKCTRLKRVNNIHRTTCIACTRFFATRVLREFLYSSTSPSLSMLRMFTTP